MDTHSETFEQLVSEIRADKTVGWGLENDLMAVTYFHVRDQLATQAALLLRESLLALVANKPGTPNYIVGIQRALLVLRPYVDEVPATMVTRLMRWYDVEIPLQDATAMADDEADCSEAMWRHYVNSGGWHTLDSLKALAATQGFTVQVEDPPSSKRYRLVDDCGTRAPLDYTGLAKSLQRG